MKALIVFLLLVAVGFTIENHIVRDADTLSPNTIFILKEQVRLSEQCEPEFIKPDIVCVG